ncbi:MAG TPA: SDR family oxidoreductase [Acidimicrobiales bacterium]|nr:SDR family oxidoreductase [Acidimicrobiales bacterium]
MTPRRPALLVTGGSGYLGAVLAPAAAAAGWEVTATSHTRPGPARLDVRDPDEVVALFRQVRPRAAVHAAYRQDGPGAWDVTAVGSGHVAEAATAVGARLVHLSTDVVFDGRAGRPYREDDLPCPLSAYGRAKAEAEHRVAAADPAAVLVRTSLVYGGPAGPESPHERAARDPGMAFYTDELRCPVQVDDLAAALVELCTLDVAGPLHVAGPEACSRHEFACRVAGHEVAGTAAPPGRPLDCRLDVGRAAALLGVRLRGVSEVLVPRP